MVITVLVNCFVVYYETRCGRELKSQFLIADALHTKSDIFVSLSVLASLGLVSLGLVWADAVVALIVAGVIAYSGYQIFKRTVPVLVDAAPVEPEVIEAIVNATPGVHSCHNIRSRGQPGNIFIEMHLVIKHPNSEVAHQITEEVERRLAQKLGQCNITIHVEPDPMSN